MEKQNGIVDKEITYLLQKVHEINEENPDLKMENDYNIFSVLQIQYKEVIICRMIADLLNPWGLHGMGSDFLKLFFRDVLEITVGNGELFNSAIVTVEYKINAERRIDIVVEIGNKFIPIEVKIYAEDQKSQCYDYAKFARKKDSSAKVYYLTRTGYAPSKYSLSGEEGVLQESDIVCISFKKHIVNWLNNCSEIANGNVKIFIDQFNDNIKKICDYTNEKVIQMVSDELCKTEGLLRAGIQIESSIDEAKSKVMKKFFEEIEIQMQPIAEKYGFVREERIKWYEYRDNANRSFYYNSNSTYPGINYVVKNAKLNNGYELWFRIEIGDVLYAGFCVFDPNEESDEGRGCQVDVYSDETRDLLENILNELEQDDWWANWWYLPTGERRISNNIPNFKCMNDVAISLANDEVRKKFILSCIEQIDSSIHKILKIDLQKLENRI